MLFSKLIKLFLTNYLYCKINTKLLRKCFFLIICEHVKIEKYLTSEEFSTKI